MRWFRNTWKIFYGNGNGEGRLTVYNVVCGPYLYNGKLYGTADNPMYSIYLRSAILDQNYDISPVSGHTVSYEYFRVVGKADNGALSSWGEEIAGAQISGQYKFHTNLAGTMIGGFSIPCNFVITKADGTSFIGDSIQASGSSTRFPSYSYCGVVWKNVKDNKSITWGSSSNSVTSATLTAEYQNSIVDFGSNPQDVPAFVKNWIEANADKVVEPTVAVSLPMKTSGGIRLYTSGKLCDRDIEIIPNLQEKTATANGEFIPPSGYVGFSKFTVNVPAPALEELTATANGEYTPNGDGFSKVTVAVPETPEWDGSFTKSVNNLTGTTWEIPSGWQTAAGQGYFTIDGELTINNTTISILQIHLGVSSSGAAANYIAVGNADGLQYFDNTNGFTLKINGGTDVTDTYIARWLGSGGKDTDWTIIRFFIEDENGDFSGYKALGGMTWAEWVASEYNTDGYIVSGTSILTANSSSIVVDSSYGTVSSSNEIISGEVYQTSAGGGN